MSIAKKQRRVHVALREAVFAAWRALLLGCAAIAPPEQLRHEGVVARYDAQVLAEVRF